MAQRLKYRIARPSVLLALSLALSSVSQAQDRAHPSLVDPATTKCIVCHADVETTHQTDVEPTGCLDCHTFISRHGESFLIDGGGTPTDSVVSAATEPIVRATDSDKGMKAAVPRADRDQAPSGSEPMRADSSSVRASDTASWIDDRSRNLYLSGMNAFQRQRYEEAFETWETMITNDRRLFTIQVEVDSYLTTAQSTIARFGANSLYVVRIKGLYFVLSGLFSDRSEAARALNLLPEPLRRGGAFPTRVEALVPAR